MYRYIIIIIAVCLLSLAVRAVAQKAPPEIPDTPAGQVLALLLKAFNSGDEDQWKSFIRDHWVPSDEEGRFEERLGFFKMVYGDMRGIELRRIEESTDESISVLLKGSNPKGPFEWVTAFIDVDTNKPYKLAGVGMRPADAPQYDVPDKKMTDDEIVAYMDKYLEEQVAQERFSGTVLVAKDGIPFYERVYGEACKRYNVPNKFDTKFNLGSG